MPPATREQLAARRQARRRHKVRRRRALASAGLPLLIAGLVALALGLAGGGAASDASGLAPPVVSGAVAGGAPPVLVIARAEGVEVHLPVSTAALTAAGYHPLDDPTAVPLEPTGSVEHGELPREGRAGPQTAGLDVGAGAGTPVYAPVDGVVSSVSDYTVQGRVEGYEVRVAVAAAGGLAVRLSHLEPYPGVAPPRVGEAVTASQTVVGQVRDFSDVAEQQLSALTSDSGNHVNLELLRAEVPAAP